MGFVMKKVARGFGSLTPSVFLENNRASNYRCHVCHICGENICEKVSVLFCSMNEKHYLYNVIIKTSRAGMTDEQVNQIIADVLELADAEGQEYIKQDLVLFARSYIKDGITSVDYILNHFFDASMNY